MKNLFSKSVIRISAVAMAVATVFGVVAANTASDMPAIAKTKYSFRQPSTPEGLTVYGCGIFAHSGNKAYTTTGHTMAEFGLHIEDMQFNPSGVNYILISSTKKTPEAVVLSPVNENEILYKFKQKTIGVPSAAVYTPDARQLLIASGKRVNVVDPRMFTLIDTFAIDLTPKKMVVSENGYYLAMTDGDRVEVINLEERRPRMNSRIEGTVTGIRFNKDVNEFAVLTDDGTLQIYDTRNFQIKNTLDEFEGGIAFDYNFDGKYVAIATAPDKIEVVNLLNPSDHQTIEVEGGNVNDLYFVPDSQNNTLLAFTGLNSIQAERMNRLDPYYGKLIAEEANERLNEWLKMMPGETMEQYRERVNDESRRKQLQKYEDELATSYAGDLLSMSTISLGNYDRANQVLQLDFDNLPSVYLPVPEKDLAAFNDAENLEFRNAVYGVTGDDKFELIYAEVYNKNTGAVYTYDNIDRVPLNYMQGDDNVVSLEIIQQQQMEELKLQEIKEQVVEEAKKENMISDHTNITVDSRVESDYDADGNRILNYKVKFSYEVDPEYTATEDFAPGKYKVEQSGASSSMLRIVDQAMHGQLAQYLKEGKKVRITIFGTADATPIHGVIAYDGSYGDFVDEPVTQNGQLKGITVTKKGGITTNEQLAFVRAEGVRNFLDNNVEGFKNMNTDYQYNIEVSKDKGSEFRRITAEFVFVDAF